MCPRGILYKTPSRLKTPAPARPDETLLMFSRRDCLKLGLGSLLGGGLVSALRLRAQAAEAGAPSIKAKAKSCILIWMDGGPSHFETFDPKPDAPAEIRGDFSAIPTKVSGVEFSQHMTKLAASLDKFSIIRSIRHDDHTGMDAVTHSYSTTMVQADPGSATGCIH